MLEQDIQKILYSENDIIRKTKKLGEQLTKDYQEKSAYDWCIKRISSFYGRTNETHRYSC